MTGSTYGRRWIRTGLFLLPLAGAAGVAGGQAAPVDVGALPLTVLEFPGGTVHEYVEQLGQLQPGLNFVVSPRARDVLLPPLSLKQVSAGTAIQLLEAVGKTAKGTLRAIRTGGERPEEHAIWIIEVSEPPPVMFAGPAPPGVRHVATPQERVQVFSISVLTNVLHVQSETILTAIETALQMVPDDELEGGPVIKFHPEAGLLMARGSADELKLVEEVLVKMEKGAFDQKQQQPPSPAVPGAPRQGDEAIAALKTENEKLRMEIDLLKQRIYALLQRAQAPADEKKAR